MKAWKNKKSSLFSPKVILSAALISQLMISSSFAETKPLYDHEEAFVKRVYQFYKEGENGIVKKQINDFLSSHPNCSFSNQLNAILGDIYAQEGLFDEACNTYAQIKDPSIYSKVALHHIHAMHQMKQWSSILEKAPALLSKDSALSNEKKQDLAKLYAFAGVATLDSLQGTERKQCAETIISSLSSFSSEHVTEPVLYTLAKAYSSLGNHEKEASLFTELASINRDKEEQYLFAAASAQAEFDKSLSKQTFQKVRALNKELANKAFFNEMVLVFELGQYDELAAQQSSFNTLNEKDSSHLFYLTALAEHRKGNYETAFQALNALPLELFSSEDLKSISLSMADCALKLKNTTYFEMAFAKVHSQFGNSPVVADMLTFHAQQSLENKDTVTALSSLKKIMQECPDHANMETVYFDFACAHYLENNWVEAHNAFSAFTTKFPNSSKKEQAWRYLLSSTCQMAKDPAFQGTPEMYTVLCNDLKDLFASEVPLNGEEKMLYSFILGKGLYEKGDHEDAFEELNAFIENHNTAPYAIEACYLLSQASNHSLEQLSTVLSKTQKLLAMADAPENQLKLHLQAFNCSLELSNINPSLFQPMAANHLYQAFTLDKDFISAANQTWLAEFLFTSLDPKSSQYPADLDKTCFVLEKILLNDDGSMTLKKDARGRELELRRLAGLYDKTENYERKIALLEDLLHHSSENEESGMRNKALKYDLAQTYSKIGKPEKAMETFAQAVDISNPFQSYYSVASLLEHSRLKFQQLQQSDLNASSDAFLEVLGCLKDLQINRNAQSEPCHIEAALDYITMRSQVLTSDDAEEKELLSLERVKEDFSSDQAEVLQPYMQYVDAEIKRIKSAHLQEAEAAELQQEAKTTLESLMNQKEGLTSYLRNKVESSYSKLTSNR